MTKVSIRRKVKSTTKKCTWIGHREEGKDEKGLNKKSLVDLYRTEMTDKSIYEFTSYLNHLLLLTYHR